MVKVRPPHFAVQDKLTRLNKKLVMQVAGSRCGGHLGQHKILDYRNVDMAFFNLNVIKR